MNFSHNLLLNHIAQTTPHPFLIDVERAEGIYLYAPDGKRYVDLISGIAVSNIGHRHPQVIKAIKDQVDKHLHVMVYGEYVQSPQNVLAKMLSDLLPDNLSCSYFTNSGAEAIEGALKLAKRYTGRSEIISFRGAYHGSTHGALSVSGNETKKSAFRPLLPGVTFIDFNKTSDLEKINDKTACVIIEPIQGDAGVRIAKQAYLRSLRDKCTETGSLLIFDEIQTGIGRTGKLFAFEHYHVVPDILVAAKALGGGLPLGAFIASPEIMNVLTHTPMLGHITTFGGNPVSCAAAQATLKVLAEEKLIDQVEEKGRLFEKLIRHDRIKEVRRKGLLFAFEFNSADEVAQIVNHCLAHGVICFWFLSCPESFRIAPPLTITEEQIRQCAATIVQAIDETMAE